MSDGVYQNGTAPAFAHLLADDVQLINLAVGFIAAGVFAGI